MFYSPKTSNDALVFHYDTGNTIRSFKGEPTVNLAANPTFNGTSNWAIASNGGGTFTTSGNYGKITAGTVGSYSYLYQTVTTAVASNESITWSVDFKNNVVGDYVIRVVLFLGSTAKTQPTTFFSLDGTGGTVRKSVTTSHVDGGNSIRIDILQGSYYQGINTDTNVEFTNVQLERSSHATPFVNGTRSATQSLLDLSGNNTINLSSVSFDSNAQMVFDGTDDTIDTGIPLTSLPALSNFSIECMVKINSFPTAAPPNSYNNTTKAGVLIGAAYYSGTALYWRGDASGTACTVYAYIRGADAYKLVGGFSLIPERYHHLVLVNNHSGGNFKLYANGTLNGSANGPTQEYNSGHATNAGNIGIVKAQVDGGGRLVYSLLPCEIPVAKIYSRALTADEVARNFNAVKSRFNIA